MKQSEHPLLEDFLYHAIFQRPGEDLLLRSILHDPTIAVYIRHFGAADDLCLVAKQDGAVCGAVWTRILHGEVKGFGNIDAVTLEFAISLLPGYRGQGAGAALMKALLRLLAEKGYPRASLAAQKDNCAVKLFKAWDFTSFVKQRKRIL